MRSTIFILSAVGVLGCGGFSDRPQPAKPLTSVTGESLDVSSRGERYYGLYVTTHSNDELLNASGVLLLPWEERPEVSIAFGDGQTMVTGIGQQVHQFPGRPLLVKDAGEKLSIVTPDIPLEAYISQKKLENWVAQSLVDAETSSERASN
ncbi:MAG: hypothetical protein RIC55_25180 [Pirellulaceae bacterium]